MLNSLLALCVGSILGALLRYGLGLAMNPLATAFPMGTLAANLVAAYVAGFAAAWLGTHPALSPAWRLLLVTGDGRHPRMRFAADGGAGHGLGARAAYPLSQRRR